MPDVALENVSKVFASGAVGVRELSLQVHHGELLVLVGPSGCGKTTTLRLIAGLETPSSGTIHFNGRSAAGVPPASRDVGFVFQRPALYPHLTVRDNLGFALQLRRRRGLLASLSSDGVDANRLDQERVHATACILGLDAVLDRYPAQLSGGQQQRVALGRALVRQPSILLLDEPLSNLDAGLRLELRRELHLLQRRLQATMVYVTHDPVEALSLGDRVAVLNKGQLRQVDCPQSIRQEPADRFVAGFVGWPPMNLIDGELRLANAHLEFETGAGKLRLPAARTEQWNSMLGRRLTLGVRPENVQLVDANTQNVWPMQLILLESYGNDVLLTLANGSLEIRVWLREYCQKSATIDTIAVGSKVMVKFDLANCYWFDGATGMRLTSVPAG